MNFLRQGFRKLDRQTRPKLYHIRRFAGGPSSLKHKAPTFENFYGCADPPSLPPLIPFFLPPFL